MPAASSLCVTVCVTMWVSLLAWSLPVAGCWLLVGTARLQVDMGKQQERFSELDPIAEDRALVLSPQ